MPERGPRYYDTHMTLVGKELVASPWLELYRETAKLLPLPSCRKTIADLGCGTGRFARHLHDLGHAGYIGIDFSGVRIAESRRYVPQFEFIQADLFSDMVPSRTWNADVFVLLEVLEHVERDLKLLSRIPKGRLVVLSVPSYPSESHVRHFRTIGEAKTRYGKAVQADRWVTLKVTSSRRIFLGRGTKT